MSSLDTVFIVTMASLLIKVKRYAQPKYIVLGLLATYALLLFLGPDDEEVGGVGVDPAPAVRSADTGPAGVSTFENGYIRLKLRVQ